MYMLVEYGDFIIHGKSYNVESYNVDSSYEAILMINSNILETL